MGNCFLYAFLYLSIFLEWALVKSDLPPLFFRYFSWLLFSFTNVAIKELMGSITHHVYFCIWIAFKHRAKNLTQQMLLPALFLRWELRSLYIASGTSSDPHFQCLACVFITQVLLESTNKCLLKWCNGPPKRQKSDHPGICCDAP